MTKQKFTYNFISKEIIGTKASINRANKGLNPEYKELTSMLKEHPDFTVVEKVIKIKEDKKTYHALSFNKMEEYIKTQPDSDKNLELFEAVKKVAKAKNAMYPLTKKWFLATFPEYKENEVAISSTEKSVNEEVIDEATAIVNALEKEVA